MTGRPVCYLVAHETILYYDGLIDDIILNHGVGNGMSGDTIKMCEKNQNFKLWERNFQFGDEQNDPNNVPTGFAQLFASVAVLSYVPGFDLGTFTELALKHEFARLKQRETERNVGHTVENKTILTQNEYLLKNYKKIGFLSTRSIQFILAQLLLTITQCHDRNIAHRDIKPSNILLVGEEWNGELLLTEGGQNYVESVENNPGNSSNINNSCQLNEVLGNTSQSLDPISDVLHIDQHGWHTLYKQNIRKSINGNFLNCEIQQNNQNDQKNDKTSSSNNSSNQCPFGLRLFPRIQLLDLGLAATPFTTDSLSEFKNENNLLLKKINNFENDFFYTKSEHNNIDSPFLFNDLQAYQASHGIDCSLDLYAIGLTVLELLLGYIPGSKATLEMVKNGVFEGEKNQIPTLPTTTRGIYKYIRSRKMDGILMEYKCYIQSLVEDSLQDGTNNINSQDVYSRHFTPEMIETFNLLLSPDPSQRYQAINSSWVQDVLSITIQQLNNEQNTGNFDEQKDGELEDGSDLYVDQKSESGVNPPVGMYSTYRTLLPQYYTPKNDHTIVKNCDKNCDKDDQDKANASNNSTELFKMLTNSSLNILLFQLESFNIHIKLNANVLHHKSDIIDRNIQHQAKLQFTLYNPFYLTFLTTFENKNKNNKINFNFNFERKNMLNNNSKFENIDFDKTILDFLFSTFEPSLKAHDLPQRYDIPL
jgi:serine/threonine protein kinase